MLQGLLVFALLDLRGWRPVGWRGKQQRDSAQGNAASQAEPCSEGKKGQHVVPVAGLADLHGSFPSGSSCLAFKTGKRTGGRPRTGKTASKSGKKPAARSAAAPLGYISPPCPPPTRTWGADPPSRPNTPQ